MPYFDHAATSFPKPAAVLAAMTEAMETFGNPARSAHGYALAATRSVEYAREEIADFFGCAAPERMVFTKNATEALNIAIHAVAGHVVTTMAEHNSILRPISQKVHTIVAVDEKGRYTLADVAEVVNPDTQAIVIGHGANLTGNIAPVAEIGGFCREKGLIFILDVAQTAGLLPINMEALGVDALCFSGHKSLYGPEGTGGLCLSRRFTPAPLMQGGSGSRSFALTQPEELPDRLEAGTLNGHGIAGLLAGLGYVRETTPQALWAAANRLARRFYEGAAALPGVRFYGDYAAGERLPVVTLNLGSLAAGDLAGWLWENYSIAVRAGAHCAPLLHQHFGTIEQGAVRFSFSAANTAAEVDLAVAALAEGQKALSQ